MAPVLAAIRRAGACRAERRLRPRFSIAFARFGLRCPSPNGPEEATVCRLDRGTWDGDVK